MCVICLDSGPKTSEQRQKRVAVAVGVAEAEGEGKVCVWACVLAWQLLMLASERACVCVGEAANYFWPVTLLAAAAAV